MECPVCFTNGPTYVVQCGSTTEHKICNDCEIQIRMRSKVTSEGRIFKCPMCRGVEKAPGKRTAFSYEYELREMYAARAPTPRVSSEEEEWRSIASAVNRLAPEMQAHYISLFPNLQRYMDVYHPVRVARPVPRIPLVGSAFCQSGNRQAGLCPTRGRTQRKCVHPGCDKYVCRNCRQCITH